jgi:hypothetical protein
VVFFGYSLFFTFTQIRASLVSPRQRACARAERLVSFDFVPVKSCEGLTVEELCFFVLLFKSCEYVLIVEEL